MAAAGFLLRSTRFAIVLAAGWTSGACTPATRGTGSDPVVSSAGASLLASVVTTEFTESETPSFALDRIDQHDLPLDQTYKHFGSGRGVTVYVFDGGILESHPELAGRVRRGYNAFPDEEYLCNAHGTAVAGAVAGATLGVAPEAEIVDVKMVECRKMRGTIDAIVRGVNWMIEDHAKHPERRAIANWSFIADTSQSVPALDSAVDRLRAAGIPVVVSAGNVEIDACHISPSNSPGVISVGASRVELDALRGTLVDNRSPGTAFGRCIDVFAPGDSVLLPSWDSEHQPIQQLWTGTSMSAGYVSGAIALYLEMHPLASTEEVTTHVERSASQWRMVDPRSPSAGMLFVGTSGSAQPAFVAKH